MRRLASVRERNASEKTSPVTFDRFGQGLISGYRPYVGRNHARDLHCRRSLSLACAC